MCCTWWKPFWAGRSRGPTPTAASVRTPGRPHAPAPSRNPLTQPPCWADCIFPRREGGEDTLELRKRLGPHIDSHPFQLGGILYLSDTPASSGCNTLWPGSHRLIYPTIAQEDNFVPREEFGRAMRQVKATIQPAEIVAAAGDCPPLPPLSLQPLL